jgi:uncharacterized protein (DUF433 family)
MMELPDFLTGAPDGEIRLSGTRISLVEVVDLHWKGYTPEKIYEEFLSPSLEHINQVLTFYFKNRAEVDAYVAEYHAKADRNSAKYLPSPGMLPVRRLRELLEQAEVFHATDPEWSTLPLGEKIRRLHLLDESIEPGLAHHTRTSHPASGSRTPFTRRFPRS